jgi:amino-acid N-acetyltransferase
MTTVEKAARLPTEVETCRANRDDLPGILTLLEASELPKEGLAAHLSTTLVAHKGNEIVGCSSLELYQRLALLRSVAVKSSFRKQGIGLEVTRQALNLAREHQITNVYLLTDTASTFFSKLGFVQISRSVVPEVVKQSVEFTTLCPESATVMTLPLS